MIQTLNSGEHAQFPTEASTLEYAQQLDAQDPLRSFREKFRIPTKASLRRKAVSSAPKEASENGHVLPGNEPSVYFCGNSLGCQPKLVASYLHTHLETWADHGVNGHFSSFEDSPLTQWQDMAESCAKKSASIIGADASEVVIMNTLTANLHLMMASFYKPTEKRHKIICEWKPFPSDFVSISSAILYHELRLIQASMQ